MERKILTEEEFEKEMDKRFENEIIDGKKFYKGIALKKDKEANATKQRY